MWARLLAAGLLVVLASPPAVAVDSAVDGAGAEETVGPEAQPALALEIERLTPAYLKDDGPIRIRGTVTNTTEEEWRAINVLPFAGTDPITDAAGLRAAMALPVSTEVGDRITAFGAYATVGDLEPGESADFDIRVRRDLIAIPDDPGAYWFGVHASGESDTTPRDGLADGKARTFLTRMPEDADARIAFVLPIRRQIERARDGALLDDRAWLADLDHGPLGDALGFANAAGDRPMTWLIDPAVVDAVSSIAEGNPDRDLGPTGTPEETGEADGAPVRPDTPAAEAAAGWLESLDDASSGSERLLLPYGDLDVAAAVRHDRSALRLALRRTLDWAGDEGTPAIAPLNGRLPGSTVAALDPGTTLILDRAALPDAGARSTVEGLTTYLATGEAASGGPGPEPTRGQVAHRQQILAEAAVRALSGESQMVVALDPGAIPEVDGSFFAGLDSVPWLGLSDLDELRADVTRGTADQLLDPVTDAGLPAENFRAARELIAAGRILDDILPLTDTLVATVETEALAGLSGWRRGSPTTAAGQLRAAAAGVQESLDSVSAVGQPVTLSAETGRFSVTVINDLAQPVQVGLSATTDGSLEITPTPPVDIGGDARVTRYLTASSELLGLHQVKLTPTDSQGRPVGQGSTIVIRSSQVSDLIWVVFALGGGLIALAIVRRLARRIAGWWRNR